MIDRRTVFEIHRLKQLGYSARMISKKLAIGRNSVKKYLEHPEHHHVKLASRASKLDPFKEFIKELVDQHSDLKAPVVLQHLKARGFEGQITIVRDYLRKVRGKKKYRTAYTRFESAPGEQVQIDWGHFGSLTYDNDKRRLYALVVTEAYTRMLYVQFTHSQNQFALHQGLINAFKFFSGCPKQVLVDNMLTAVTERCGAVIRFNESFLDFLRIFKITPQACNIRAPYEKGKVESSVKYLRHNFWPLRSFENLADAQRQVVDWLNTVANVRIHQTTGQRPLERIEKGGMHPLPDLLPDCRESRTLMVHKDFAVRFDTNAYTVPPWTLGKKLTVKADNDIISIYDRHRKIATHPRCWARKKRIELPAHVNAVKKLNKRVLHSRQVSVFLSWGQTAVDYLKKMATANLPIKKDVVRLLYLKDQYGTESVLWAIEKAMAHGAIGADYIENILYQEMTPKSEHPPVRLKDEALNRIRLTRPQLADYDAYAIKRRRGHD